MHQSSQKLCLLEGSLMEGCILVIMTIDDKFTVATAKADKGSFLYTKSGMWFSVRRR